METLPTFNLSSFVAIPDGETVMAERLRLLGWNKTERFFNVNVYYAGHAKRGTLKVIGYTIYRPRIHPCAHTHYALPV